jgi:hypothetical protein
MHSISVRISVDRIYIFGTRSKYIDVLLQKTGRLYKIKDVVMYTLSHYVKTLTTEVRVFLFLLLSAKEWW